MEPSSELREWIENDEWQRMNVSEQLADAYLQDVGVQLRSYTKAEMRKSKTPDFSAWKNGEFCFFVEVKALLEDEMEPPPSGFAVASRRTKDRVIGLAATTGTDRR